MELRVMVVDDDKMFNLIAKVLLRDTGIACNPTICTNGEEALETIGQEIALDKFFLVFLDINMPVKNGWQVLDALQAFPYPENIHVVIVTSSINKADMETAKTYPQLIDYLIKPIKRESLLALKSSNYLTTFFSY